MISESTRYVFFNRVLIWFSANCYARFHAGCDAAAATYKPCCHAYIDAIRGQGCGVGNVKRDIYTENFTQTSLVIFPGSNFPPAVYSASLHHHAIHTVWHYAPRARGKQCYQDEVKYLREGEKRKSRQNTSISAIERDDDELKPWWLSCFSFFNLLLIFHHKILECLLPLTSFRQFHWAKSSYPPPLSLMQKQTMTTFLSFGVLTEPRRWRVFRIRNESGNLLKKFSWILIAWLDWERERDCAGRKSGKVWGETCK